MTFRLINERVRANALEAVRNAPDGHIVTISEPTRSRSQNSFFHALCTDLEKSETKWLGKRRGRDAWKSLLISGHAEATKAEFGQRGEVIPGFEGEFVSIRESSASMGVKRANSLIEYTVAYCVNNGVELRETRRGGFME